MANQRQQILDLVKARLEAITLGATYDTTVTNVFLRRTKPLNSTEMPAINIMDTERVEAITFGEEIHILNLEMELYAAGQDADNTIRSMVRDIMVAINQDRTFTGLVDDVVLEREDELDEEMASMDFYFATYRVELEYATAVYSN